MVTHGGHHGDAVDNTRLQNTWKHSCEVEECSMVTGTYTPLHTVDFIFLLSLLLLLLWDF